MASNKVSVMNKMAEWGEDNEDDLEALRLAALQSLKTGNAIKSNVVKERGRGKVFKNRYKMNTRSNLITIVPISDTLPVEATSSIISSVKDSKYASIHHQCDEKYVPSKFNRYEDFDSDSSVNNSDDEFHSSRNQRSCSEDIEVKDDCSPLSTYEAKEEDSLEILMDQLEQEINGIVPESKKTIIHINSKESNTDYSRIRKNNSSLLTEPHAGTFDNSSNSKIMVTSISAPLKHKIDEENHSSYNPCKRLKSATPPHNDQTISSNRSKSRSPSSDYSTNSLLHKSSGNSISPQSRHIKSPISHLALHRSPIRYKSGLSPSRKRSTSPSSHSYLRNRSPSPLERRLSPRHHSTVPRPSSPRHMLMKMSPRRKHSLSPVHQFGSPNRWTDYSRRRSPSIWSRSVSPKGRTVSPTRKVFSPRQNSYSPRRPNSLRRSRSPRQRLSPPRRTGSPSRSSHLLHATLDLPGWRSVSPRRSSISPRKCSGSPDSFSASSRKQRSGSSKRFSLSPVRRSLSRRSISRSPRGTSVAHKSATLNRRADILKQISMSPRNKSLSPRKRLLSPRLRSPLQKKRQFSLRLRSPSFGNRSVSPSYRPLSPRKRSITPRNLSTSPLSRSSSPRTRSVSGRTKPISPRDRQMSPRDRQMSPRDRQMSPRDRQMSPRDRQMSPRDRPMSPRDRPMSQRNRLISLRNRSISPKDRFFSLRNVSISPRRRPMSPRKRSMSPRNRALSPRKTSISPRKRSVSPRNRSVSPRKRSISPRRRSVSPRKRSLSPRKRSLSPRKRSLSPRKRSLSPRKRSMSPRMRSVSPRKRSVSPRRKGSLILGRRLSQNRKSSVSPRRKRSVSPRRKRSVSPRRKKGSISPRRKRSVSPRRKRSVSPRRKRSVSPRRKRSVSPRRKRSVSPRRKRSVSPRRKRSVSPRRKSSVSPRLKSSLSPSRKRSASPRNRNTSPQEPSIKLENINQSPWRETLSKSEGSSSLSCKRSAPTRGRYTSSWRQSSPLKENTISEWKSRVPGDREHISSVPQACDGKNILSMKCMSPDAKASSNLSELCQRFGSGSVSPRNKHMLSKDKFPTESTNLTLPSSVRKNVSPAGICSQSQTERPIRKFSPQKSLSPPPPASLFVRMRSPISVTSERSMLRMESKVKLNSNKVYSKSHIKATSSDTDLLYKHKGKIQCKENKEDETGNSGPCSKKDAPQKCIQSNWSRTPSLSPSPDKSLNSEERRYKSPLRLHPLRHSEYRNNSIKSIPHEDTKNHKRTPNSGHKEDLVHNNKFNRKDSKKRIDIKQELKKDDDKKQKPGNVKEPYLKKDTCQSDDFGEKKKGSYGKISTKTIGKSCESDCKQDKILEARRRKFETSGPLEPSGKILSLKAPKLMADNREMTDEDLFDKTAADVDDFLDLELDKSINLWSSSESDSENEARFKSHKQHGTSKRVITNEISKLMETSKIQPSRGENQNRCEGRSVRSSGRGKSRLHLYGKTGVQSKYKESLSHEPSIVSPSKRKINEKKKGDPTAAVHSKTKVEKHKKPKSDSKRSEEPSESTDTSAAKDGDLRAELSRRRAERLIKAGSLDKSLPARLLQSAFQGVVGRKNAKNVEKAEKQTGSKSESEKRDKDKSDGRRVMVLKPLLVEEEDPENVLGLSVTVPKERKQDKSPSKLPIHLRLGLPGKSWDPERKRRGYRKVKVKRSVLVSPEKV